MTPFANGLGDSLWTWSFGHELDPTCMWSWMENKWHPLEPWNAVDDRKTPCGGWQQCFLNQAEALGLQEREDEALQWNHSEEELCAPTLRGATVVAPLHNKPMKMTRDVQPKTPPQSSPDWQLIFAPGRRNLVPSRNSSLPWLFCTIPTSGRKSSMPGTCVCAPYFHCYSKEHQKLVYSSKHLLWHGLESPQI